MYHITTMNFKPRYYSHLQKKLLIDSMTFGTEGQGRVMGGGGGGEGVRMRFCMLQCLWTFPVIMNGFFSFIPLQGFITLFEETSFLGNWENFINNLLKFGREK